MVGRLVIGQEGGHDRGRIAAVSGVNDIAALGMR